ncbi:hypothetical protein K438DRAFT_1771282 [Mycena galopus ATCC 62051]|nr:hypothetical protein K438DRAFT_1771282 [Mycena galopus ATCC 62051]
MFLSDITGRSILSYEFSDATQCLDYRFLAPDTLSVVGLPPVTVATVRRHPSNGCCARPVGTFLLPPTARRTTAVTAVERGDLIRGFKPRRQAIISCRGPSSLRGLSVECSTPFLEPESEDEYILLGFSAKPTNDCRIAEVQPHNVCAVKRSIDARVKSAMNSKINRTQPVTIFTAVTAVPLPIPSRQMVEVNKNGRRFDGRCCHGNGRRSYSVALMPDLTFATGTASYAQFIRSSWSCEDGKSLPESSHYGHEIFELLSDGDSDTSEDHNSDQEDMLPSAKTVEQPPHKPHTTTPKDQVLLLVKKPGQSFVRSIQHTKDGARADPGCRQSYWQVAIQLGQINLSGKALQETPQASSRSIQHTTDGARADPG